MSAESIAHIHDTFTQTTLCGLDRRGSVSTSTNPACPECVKVVMRERATLQDEAARFMAAITHAHGALRRVEELCDSVERDGETLSVSQVRYAIRISGG